MRRFLIVFFIFFFFPLDVMAESLVSNVFVDVDIRQALRDVSSQAGVVIVADNTVEGFVSADLKDVPLEKALDILLSHYGYVFAKKDGYYLVGSPDIKNFTFNGLSKTIFYRPKYLSIDAMKQRISDSFSQFIKIDSSSNIISITAPDSMVDNIVTKIKEIDKPVRLIYVDVLYAKTSYSDISRLLPTEVKVEWKLDEDSGVSDTGMYFTDLKLGYFYNNTANIDLIMEILKSKDNAMRSARFKFLVLERESSSLSLEERTYRKFVIENYTTTVSFSSNIEMGILAEVIDNKVMLELELLASYIEGDLKKSLGSTKTVVSLDSNNVAILGGVTDYRELSKRFGVFKPYIGSDESSRDSFTVFMYAREIPEELVKGVLPVLESSSYSLTKLPGVKREDPRGLVISGGPITVIDISTSNLSGTTVNSGVDLNCSFPIDSRCRIFLDGIYIQDGLKSLSLSFNYRLISDIITGLSYRLARDKNLSIDALNISIEEETYPYLTLSFKGKVFGLFMNDSIQGKSYSDIGIDLSASYKISDYTTLKLEYFRTLDITLLSSARMELEFKPSKSLSFAIGYDYRDSKYFDNIITPSYGRGVYFRVEYKL
ncbi:MAG: hypothetical protein ACPL1I_00540 [bacterium]